MFRFTIRDLLWLMVVVAFGCGWWLTTQGLHDEYEVKFNANKARVQEFIRQQIEFRKEIEDKMEKITARAKKLSTEPSTPDET